MTLPDIVAILSNEPFDRSIAEIKRLTLFQINEIIFRRKDNLGRVMLDVLPFTEMSAQQRLVSWCAVNKVPVWWAREKYGKSK